MLPPRFMRTTGAVDTMLEDGRTLTGVEIEALFRAELESELRFYGHSAYEDAPWSSSVTDVAAQEAEALFLSAGWLMPVRERTTERSEPKDRACRSARAA